MSNLPTKIAVEPLLYYTLIAVPDMGQLFIFSLTEHCHLSTCFAHELNIDSFR